MTDHSFRVAVSSNALPVAPDLYQAVLADAASVDFLPGLDAGGREAALRAADALVTLAPQAELSQAELGMLDRLRFVQTLSAGIDHLPPGLFPKDMPIGNTAGAAAPAIAEHALAMALAAAKRLPAEQANLAVGRFGYGRLNRMLGGGTACLYGFGEIGRESARLLRGIGMRVEAINRSGRGGDLVDRIGTDADLDDALTRCDLLVVTASLNPATRGRIGAAALARMKEDAILVVVSRAAIVDEAALYRHLLDKPGFTACIDTWWREEMRPDAPFAQAFPFMELPNVVGSPHNSGLVPGVPEAMARSAAENVRRFLAGEGEVRLVADPDRP